MLHWWSSRIAPQLIVMVGDNRVTGRPADVIGHDPTNVDNLSIAAVNRCLSRPGYESATSVF